MASPRTCLRPFLSSSRGSQTICTRCISTLRRRTTPPTNHQRPSSNSSSTTPSRSLHTTPRMAIARPMLPILQQVQQQPVPPPLEAPPPGYRMNKITRPFVPVATHMRIPFKVNESAEVLNEMYNKLLGPGGDEVLSEQVKWQCVTHKSFDHGLQPYNSKLIFYGRRVAWLHASLYMIHRPYNPVSAPPGGSAEGSPIPIEELSNDPSLLLPVITRRNPINKVNYMSIDNLMDSTNMFGIAKTCGMISCLRWKPRNPGDLVSSGVAKVAQDAILAIVGAVALQKGGDAARRVMEERILPGARVAEALREKKSL